MRKNVLVFLLAVILIAVSAKYLFEVRQIDVVGDTLCINNSQAEDELHLKGRNIFFINLKQSGEILKNSNSCIESITASRKIPSGITYTVSAKTPVAKIDGTDLFMTAEGLVIAPAKTPNVPVIYLPSNITVQKGEVIKDPEVDFAALLTANLLKSDFQPASLRFINNIDIAVYSTFETVAIFSTQKDAATQVDSLQVILTKAKIDPAKIDKIDLRFDKPIIVNK